MSGQQMPARIWTSPVAGYTDDPKEILIGDVAYVRADLAERMAEALEVIACFSDKGASDILAKTGSYSSFDEPGSVRTAREVLATLSAFRSATQDTEARHD